MMLWTVMAVHWDLDLGRLLKHPTKARYAQTSASLLVVVMLYSLMIQTLNVVLCQVKGELVRQRLAYSDPFKQGAVAAAVAATAAA